MKRLARCMRLAAVLVLAVAMAGCPNPAASVDAAPRGAVELVLEAATPEEAVGLRSAAASPEAGPVGEIRAILVRILRVELCRVDSDWTVAVDFGDGGRVFDLLALADDAAALGFAELEAGEYEQIRLILARDNEILADRGAGDETLPLRVPSGENTGVKLVGGFIVGAAGVTRVPLAFDPYASVHLTGSGEYLLRPAVRVGEVTTRPYLVNDPFDSYAEGAYPSSWGWYNLWSGAGVGRATAGQAYEGDKSFMQTGYANWVRADGIGLDLTGRTELAWRAALRVASGSQAGAHLGFFQRVASNESREYDAVVLNPGSEIMAYGTEGRGTGVPCVADAWYLVEVRFDLERKLMDVSVDGVERVTDLPMHDIPLPAIIFVGTGWTGWGTTTTIYTDSFKVW